MKLRDSANITKFSWRNFLWISIVHLIAVSLGWYYFTWSAFVIFIVLHYLTGMYGITFGFHRLLSHKSFKAALPVEYSAAFFGTLACQGGPISWVGQHRVHHAFSDKSEDPHNINKGFWHSHIGFIFNRRADLNSSEEVAHYCPDIAKNKYYMFLEKNMIPIQFVVGFLLLGLGGLIGSSPGFDWHNALSFTIWGVFVRLVTIYHVTWFVNSATHKWGTRPIPTNDESRNNWWVGILAFGEGWHNHHHAQPRSARHGWKWWQFDQTWLFINLLESLKLLKDVKRPNTSILNASVQAAQHKTSKLHTISAKTEFNTKKII
jgi:stearoyl-CoA desaturase (delta-9 desaturase)